MPIVCAAKPFVSRLRLPVVCCGAAWVSGCSSQLDPLSAGLFSALAALALATVAALSAALAWLLAGIRQRKELRQCQQALRQSELLQSDWTWRTANDHRLLSWWPPAHTAQLADGLFEGPDQALLLERLQRQHAFDRLRLRTPAAASGFRVWEVCGLPVHDDAGAFAGFCGTARPTEVQEQRQLDAAAFVALLAAQDTPSLMALDGGDGLRVVHFNQAVVLLWPTVAAGQLLSQLMVQTPEAALRAAQLAPGAAPVQVQGWRLQALLAAAHSPDQPSAQRPARAPTQHPSSGILLTRLAADAAQASPTSQAESDTFSFTLSHDLRAPIRVVEGFTRIVKEDYGRLLDRVGNDHLDRVLGAATRMNLMIEALLTLARLSQQPLAQQRVNLSQLAGLVADDLRRSAPERDAQIDIEPQLTAWGDPTLLRLVLENLLGNAWKYSGRCPQTRMSLARVQHGERFAFVVRDNGAGFDMRTAERLFGLFQRLHSASDFPGHGVGLASVRRIVQRHGGDIWAEAEPGVGAAFYFTLAA